MTAAASTTGSRCALVWFRDDLRIRDNPALHAACGRGTPVVALYVLDEQSEGIRPLGSASRWWLHSSLERLAADLRRLGMTLVLRRGAARRIVPDIARRANAATVFWNRRYAGAEVAVDAAVKTALTEQGREVESFSAKLLFEPWTLQPASGPHYRVFTPFWKAALRGPGPRAPLAAPGRSDAPDVAPDAGLDCDALDDWSLRPSAPDWSGGLAETWTPGETGALQRLDRFLDDGYNGYAHARNRPDRQSTSMLSPHLRFGEISPHQIWHAVRAGEPGNDAEKFLAEIGWREFSWHLLFHNPKLSSENYQSKFDRFPWRNDEASLAAWQRGRTGIPIVDAGMRQLWETGWMHNRVRMIVASFLIKNLMIDWRQGEAWFWDTLVDADAGNNPAGWQWVAGSGADAAPYFRIFNPVLQGETHDPDGEYVRRWVPELGDLSDKVVHRPWEASEAQLQKANVELGSDYPDPIVDLGETRKRALAAFKALTR